MPPAGVGGWDTDTGTAPPIPGALALSALELPGGASLAIELGVALDLILVAVVAGVFHERIFAEFGAGDTAALRALRD